MDAPLVYGTIPDETPTITTIKFGRVGMSYAEMKLRAGRDYTDGADAPSALRAAPLLSVSGAKGERRIVVGSTLVVVSDNRHAAYEVTVVAVWAERGVHGCFALANPESNQGRADRDKAEQHLLASLPSWRVNFVDMGIETLAAQLAKELAEDSRNALSDLREVRYELERQLADSSGESPAVEEQTSIVSSLLQLNIICGRAADQAREAAREGMWVHVTDPEAYQSYRRLLDPTIINEHPPATAATRPWMRLHDAAMRQCLEMRKQLDAESAAIRTLLASASSISSSREADAQTRFNTLVAVFSLGLGVPALVLALYGADMIVPLNTIPRQIAFLPVALGLIVAAGIAAVKAPRGRGRTVWLVGAISILLVLVLLFVAGIMAPAR